MGTERTPAAYGAQITEMCLQALGMDSRRIAAVMNHELPSLLSDVAIPGAKTA